MLNLLPILLLFWLRFLISNQYKSHPKAIQMGTHCSINLLYHLFKQVPLPTHPAHHSVLTYKTHGLYRGGATCLFFFFMANTVGLLTKTWFGIRGARYARSVFRKNGSGTARTLWTAPCCRKLLAAHLFISWWTLQSAIALLIDPPVSNPRVKILTGAPTKTNPFPRHPFTGFQPSSSLILATCGSTKC